MRYVRARLEAELATTSYRVYMTDSIYHYARGNAVVKRWMDIVKQAPEDNRSAEEIVEATILNAGLTLKE